MKLHNFTLVMTTDKNTSNLERKQLKMQTKMHDEKQETANFIDLSLREC